MNSRVGLRAVSPDERPKGRAPRLANCIRGPVWGAALLLASGGTAIAHDDHVSDGVGGPVVLSEVDFDAYRGSYKDLHVAVPNSKTLLVLPEGTALDVAQRAATEARALVGPQGIIAAESTSTITVGPTDYTVKIFKSAGSDASMGLAARAAREAADLRETHGIIAIAIGLPLTFGILMLGLGYVSATSSAYRDVS